MKIELCYILSKIDKALSFEWISEHIDHSKYALSFILLVDGETELELFLKEKKIPCVVIPFYSKKDYPSVLWRLIRELRRISPKIIHCHLFDATFLGLIASRILGIRKRIFTRHHATYNHEYVKKMVPFDKFCNFLATDIVAISENVSFVLQSTEKQKEAKVHLIRHGFDLDYFRQKSAQRINQIRNKYNPESKGPVIGVIARYLELKGYQYLIPAFRELLKEKENALLIIANANGPFKEEVERLLQDIPKENYRTISFESDVVHLYSLFDIFIHVPINKRVEAFGQIYIEALASGIPSIFTLSGVASEFIEHEKNALVVDFKNTSHILEAMRRLLSEEQLKMHLIQNGLEDVKKFDFKVHIERLERLYEC